MRTYLITGAAGFIGSNFVEFILKKAKKVVVLDALTYAGHLENLQEHRERVTFVEGDITDEALVSALLREHGIDTLVNFAAESHVDRSISDPESFVRTNVLGVFNLLSAFRIHYDAMPDAQKKTARFIQVSTDEVFGSLGDEGYFSETTTYAPNSPYSASKAGGDHLARAWFHTFKLPVIVTNCSNNYGPKQFPEKLIPLMINCALSEKAMPIYGQGINVRDWIHVMDHSAGIDLAIEKGVPGESYCFGGRSERKNLDVVNAICEELDKQVPRRGGGSYKALITFVEDRKGHDWRYAIDDSKAERDLGFKRKYTSFEQGLEQTIAWYLGNRVWMDAVMGKSK
ncbi:MAG: dTDP-glucose 4,6-dehydratase [Proteobacteria bacterium]|nr:MAG: dTDP-glucose 4,6-dehydratase [Pseudomonadota bacterium]